MRKITKNMNRSVKPRYQHKFLALAPLHLKQKFVKSHLSKELKLKLKKRNIIVRKGDEVKIMRGQFKGKIGKVNKVLIKRTRVYVEGIENIKKDGSKALYPIHPSKVMITKLGNDDKKRKKSIERK